VIERCVCLRALRWGLAGPTFARMKRSLLCLALTALLAGCGAVSDVTSGVRETFAERNAPHLKSFSAPQREVYEAVRAAAGQLGYRFVRGGAAQGEYEGISSVRAGETVGTARQRSIKVKLDRALDGGTEVAVRVNEINEADSSNRAGLATESPLRDPTYYDIFFGQVERMLPAKR